MNFLAHLYLSGDNESLRFGNFVGDAVRGNQLARFPEDIQRGIILHRKIDSFTDEHPIFRKHCKLLYPDHGHYARVILDVIYDYFIASNWSKFHSQTLNEYAAAFYLATKEREHLLPASIERLFALMQKQNWLLQYASLEGLEHILFHMNKRTSFPSQFPQAVTVLKNEEQQMLPDFFIFFDELINYCNNQSI